MTESQIQKLMRKIEQHQKIIQKETESLRDFVNDLESLASDCDEAWKGLEQAKDALSRLN